MKKTLFIIFSVILLPLAMISQVCPGADGQLQWKAYFGTFGNEIGQLTALSDFPTRPNVEKTIYKLQTPINYAESFGGQVRGFINVPSATTVTFNVTGDDQVRFHLSTDASPDNLVLAAYLDQYASVADHDKYESQNSVPIDLQPGIDYYFELTYVEGYGGDHATVYWKTDLVNPTEWNIITAGFLKGVECTPDECLEVGTPCDDGDSNTTNDQEDGFCNCAGSPVTSNSCIGERGVIEVFRYDNITGSDINDLYEAPAYPGDPDYSHVLPQLSRPYSNEINDFGSLIQSYISVPVSGNYKFNVTGDDNTVFFLSSNDDPDNKQAHQALVSGSTGMTQHDRYIWQSTGNIYLNADEYYYFEVNFKHGGGGEHFSIYWQTPYTETDVWKRIPSTYIYDYDCEIACIAEGVPCDDGDPFTNSDMYNDQCECAGTPCSGPDCDSPLASYVPYDKCAVTDQIDNNAANNWLSCQSTPNPNDVRPDGHWIMYDLGERHELHSSQIWNYNVLGETANGFQNVAVDISDDGVSWTEYGTYTWPQATGDAGYSGFSGPNFMGSYARYITITSLDDPSTCKGLGKVAFTAVLCPLSGTACDDDNIYTINDRYNNDCLCQGDDIGENECVDQNLTLGDSTLFTDIFSAEVYVNSISKIASDNVVSFVGGASITLNPGFETEDNTLFLATIDTCETIAGRAQQIISRSDIIEQRRTQQEEDKLKTLQVIKDETTDWVTVKFYLPSGEDVKLQVVGSNGRVVSTLADHTFINGGLYEKRFRTKTLDSGIYTVQLLAGKLSDVKRVSVL